MFGPFGHSGLQRRTRSAHVRPRRRRRLRPSAASRRLLHNLRPRERSRRTPVTATSRVRGPALPRPVRIRNFTQPSPRSFPGATRGTQPNHPDPKTTNEYSEKVLTKFSRSYFFNRIMANLQKCAFPEKLSLKIQGWIFAPRLQLSLRRSTKHCQ